ncbi:DUF4864 domain-containing protein [Gloeobacter kilaueensis]|uniref:DUF4864 domain-containing protein n=1 Tax=Gloeobacter kilaueensis (strain ATCC BAA-2537 / CCAP 1431/1 / ULC 316 / JS1) TaxID=1183438 RepID=U5QCL0_GLOK1|nr:DUF4864 domain-containing protein [Gloeobacter kilaueensis]AGY56657.1 hypothetical protein GKIL_0411 [Gloeobacter kilaueensis JS1]
MSDSDSEAIRTVIQKQLAAFQQDNAEAAFAFAAPEIQAMFATPTDFLNMVISSYRAIYRPRSVLFEDLVLVRNTPTQPVLLLDTDGSVKRAVYMMRRQANGEWRIGGCVLQPVR